MWTLNAWFFGSLAACLLLAKHVPGLRGLMSTLAEHLAPRAFPSHSTFEHNKFALLRVLFGLIIFARGLDVYGLLLDSERFSAVGLWAGAETLAGALLALGLLTQWVLVFLIGAMWQYGDLVVAKSTLGNDIGAILAVLLLLVNAGKYLSLDSALLKRLPSLHRFLLYYSGVPGQEAIFYAKFTALASYWAVCVYSIAIHLNEPAWMDGSAGPLLLSNNFMAVWHEQFSALFSSSALAVGLAKGSLWMMMLWYPAVLPFVLLGGWFRLYVIVWGWLFFAMSMFFLQLGYLAEIEVVLWLALFWSDAGLARRQPLEVLYDDRCNLCDRTVQAVTLLDVFGRVNLRPLSKNKPLLDEIGLDLEQALTDLYGVDGHSRRLFRGYDFYVQLSRTLALLWPLLPLLLLGRLLWIGPRIYRFIAERRTRLFGVCELPRRKFLRSVRVEESRSGLPQAVTLHVCLLILFYFAAVPAPYMGWSGLPNLGARLAHIYGITPIDVFNKTDLRMAENWFVLDSVDFHERIPLLAEDGSRLSMHASDRLYFGHTLRYRRAVIGKPGCHFETWRPLFEYTSRIYLQQRGVEAGEYDFRYRQFHQPLVSAEDIAHNQFKIMAPEMRCELDFKIAYRK
jgi:predicted DCC family thiol-disulfide oxidoreductase YuxK